MPINLSSITRGKIAAPYRLLVWGVPGIGKSTFAAGAPAPIFLPIEEGSNNLDVARFPQPRSWAEIIEAVRVLGKDKHDYKTLVLDTLDVAESLCWQEVCRKGGKQQIEEFGYGKGYVAAVDEWRALLVELEQLQKAKGMNVILIAHGLVKTFNNPEGENYDRNTLRLHEKSGGLIQGWCEEVLFARWEVAADKGKGYSTGKRLLHTTHAAAWDAKNRHGLPPELPLSFEAFAGAMDAAALGPAALRARIDCAINTMPDKELAKKAQEALVKAGMDTAKLLTLEGQINAKKGAK